jgi:hypothetical protein
MKRHHSIRPLYEYKAGNMNSAGYWMSFSAAVMVLRGEALKQEGTTGVEEVERFDVWTMMAVRCGLRVVGPRIVFYKRSAKDVIHAWLVMPVLGGHKNTPTKGDVDDVMEKLDTHMATQLMKAAASLLTTNYLKCSGTAERPLSSQGIPQISAMARDAASIRGWKVARGVGQVPCRSVWDSEATLGRFQQR